MNTETANNIKTLANCTPTEFIRQTVKIKRAVEKWLKDTDIMAISKKTPELKKLTKDMSDEERVEAFNENKRISAESVRNRMSMMFDKIFEEYPEETLEIMALCCFVEHEDINKHTMSEYLSATSSLLNDQGVIDFFTSLARLGLLNIK